MTVAPAMTADQIRAAAADVDLGARADAILNAALPAIRLKPTPAAGTFPEGVSRFGGLPDLASGQRWPSTASGPLAFVAQINLAAVRASAAGRDLPETGLLSFFFDPTQAHWGFDPKDAGHAAVLYAPAGPYRRAEPPANLDEGGRFVECGIAFHERLTLPSPDSTAFTELGLAPEQREQYLSLIDAIREHGSFEGEGCSWLLGHADPVQDGSMQEECALVTGGLYCGEGPPITDPRHRILARRASDWRLLLQVASEEAAGMMWGDLGSLYYWIRHEDLAAARFEASWTIVQCF